MLPLNLDCSSLEPLETRFAWKGKHHVLTEASEDAHVRYRNAQYVGAKLDEEGRVVSMGSLYEVEPLLVSLCLYEVEGPDAPLRLLPNGNPDPRHRVPEETVRGWPSRIVTSLFDWAAEASEIRQKVTAELLERQIATLTRQLEEVRKKADRSSSNGSSSEGKDGTHSIDPLDRQRNGAAAGTATSPLPTS